MKTIYIPISVEDENDLPKESNYYTVILENNPSYIATVWYFNSTIGWGKSMNSDIILKQEMITHWLKPIQITEQQFNELLK